MPNLTYTEWIEKGRNVIKGQRAAAYRVNPDLVEGVAVFSEDQTEPMEQINTEGWEEMSAEKWLGIKKARKQGASKPKVIVDYMDSTKTTTVWCGNNKKAINALQKAGYRFNMRIHRWTVVGRDPMQVVTGWEDWGFDVELGEQLAKVPSI